MKKILIFLNEDGLQPSAAADNLTELVHITCVKSDRCFY